MDIGESVHDELQEKLLIIEQNVPPQCDII